MRITACRRFASSLCAAAVLAGCGGSQPSIGAPTATIQTEEVSASRNAATNDQREARQTLLYFYGTGRYLNDNVYVVAWPQGVLQQVLGPIWAINGICADDKGNVFVLSWGPKGYVTEYEHGAVNPKQRLTQPEKFPIGCAVDATTGDLAVTSGNAVSIFKEAKGRPVRLTDPTISVYDYDAYDRHGDLFIDGHAKNHAPAFAELVKGSKTFINLKLDKSIGRYPTTMQWVQSGLAVSTQWGHTIYQIQVSGSKGTVVGSTSLGQCGPIDTFIFKNQAIANCGFFDVYTYPKGAPPIKIYKELARYAPVGLVVSK